MWLNPIVKKDVKVQARSMRMCWGVFAYELILALVFFLAMLVIQGNSRYSTDNIYSYMVWLYPVLGVTQLIVLGLVVPVRTASSISGEKERQTFDIMMTTSMTPFSIVMGKVMTAVVQSMFFVVASMPIMALSFIIGGVSWSYLFWFLGVALLVSFFTASIGILCSSLCKKSISAVILSYVFYLGFFVGTALPLILLGVGLSLNDYIYSTDSFAYTLLRNVFLFLLLNPALYLVEFFTRVMVSESVVNTLIEEMRESTMDKTVVDYVGTGYWWIVLSTIMFLLVSFLFLWLASRRINPIRGHVRRKVAQTQPQMQQQPVVQAPQQMQQPAMQTSPQMQQQPETQTPQQK
ncbi:MAG: ABC transporter permease [Acetatifactor sp.]|nr:ABC transporter permease [Acetatifactor sp.]